MICYASLIGPGLNLDGLQTATNDNIIRTNCGHYFHQSCLNMHMTKRQTCPINSTINSREQLVPGQFTNLGSNPQGGGYRKHKKHMTRRLINIKGINIKGKIREVKITRKGNITVRGNIYGVKVGKRKSRKLINRNTVNRNKRNRNKKMKKSRKMLNKNKK